jgi:branched-chain amino acid transport system substrate-binding protein
VRRLAAALAVLAALVGFAGCGATTDAHTTQTIHGKTLTIYSSVPLHGASAVSAEAVLDGERLALQQARGRIGDYQIVLRSLDDSTAQAGEWDPGQTTLNARMAIADPTTIGYIGEFNSGASAISIPLLNRAGIPQISPTSTAVGLTTDVAGASPGEPAKYYPTGRRTFARIVPNDSMQATTQVTIQRGEGCRKTYVLDDGEVDGADMASSFTVAAQSEGFPVAGVQMFDPSATSYTSLAAGIAKTGADCVLISAITENNAVLLTKAIAAALPHALIFGSAGLAESSYTDPAQGGIPLSIDPRVLITVATVAPPASPTMARGFVRDYAEQYGPPEPYASFGYEAMSLMLNAISRATDRGHKPALRLKVLAAIFATRNRHSVLGTYSIKPDGDTTLRRYGVYRVVNGQLVYWQTITA